MSQPSPLRVSHAQGATFVELFYDLVFVFAITQLTATVLHDLTWSGVGRAALLFWLVWWSWTQFTWTLNPADTEHPLVRLPVLAATAVAFFLAQAIPDAFGSAGPWFAITYVLGRVLGLGLQQWVSRGDAVQQQAFVLWVSASALGLGLVLAGGAVDGSARIWLWAAVIPADLLAAGLAGRGSWKLDAGHFAERHGLILIIALGESLIAAGVATAGLDRDLTFAVTTAAAVVGACALWWTYFGSLHARLEAALAAQETATRAQLARDVFSLWHALVVAGVIGIAAGFEEAIAHPDEALHLDAALALTLGLALFVGGLAGAAHRGRARQALALRLGFATAAVAATPLIPNVSPAVTLWVVSGAVIALAVAEHRVTASPSVPAYA